MGTLFIDDETRSRVELGTCGQSKYARDPSTEVLCVCFSLDGGPIRTWRPGEPVPAVFFEDHDRCAHNAAFEQEIEEHILVPQHGFPLTPPHKWHCTAAQAGHAGLAQKLSAVSDKLQLGDYGKDKSGNLRMKRLAKPVYVKGIGHPELIDGYYYGGGWDETPAKHRGNEAYCSRDVKAELVSKRRMPPLTNREQAVWQMHRRICKRGVPVDVELCKGAARIVERESLRYLAEFQTLTDGIKNPDCREALQEWLRVRGVDMRKDPDDATEQQNLQGATIDRVLEDLPEGPERRVLEIKQLLASAAVAKFQTVLDWVDDDGRVRNGFKYYGAGPGRWSGTGPQMQNLKKSKLDDATVAAWLPAITAGDYNAVHTESKGQVLDFMANFVRPIVQAPPGRKLVISDFAAIEARVLAWMAGCDTLLDIFYSGADLYAAMACQMFGYKLSEIFLHDANVKLALDEHGKKIYVPGGKAKRDSGKPPFLGAGYQMAAPKLKKTADKAGLPITDEIAVVCIDTFRTKFHEIPQFWRDVESAANRCVDTGRPISHHKFRFRMQGRWLVMRIPSGRDLFYFNPRFEPSERFQGREQLVYDSPKGKKQLYGGLWTENEDQALSRDLLVDAMFRMEAVDLDVILHCHDEAVVECDIDDEVTPKLVHSFMETIAPWAEGIPVVAETHSSIRYSK